METNVSEQVKPITANIFPAVCLVCHQPLLSSYYFCPNCGTKVGGKDTPLETTTEAQVKIYALSIFQPMILFLLYSKWHGIKYFKSKDPKTHQIGQIAWALLIMSTLFTIWLTYTSFVWLTQFIQKSVSSSIDADFPSGF